MNSSRYEKNQLIEHLLAVCAAETEKPYEEIDADFVEACTELILELQGKNFALSNEELEEKVRKIPFVEVSDFEAYRQEKNKKINKSKILLIAALIAILFTLLSIVSVSNEYDYTDIFSYIKENFGTMMNVPEDVPVIHGNQELVISGKPKVYTSIKDFCKNESLDVLMPTGKLPNEIEVRDVAFKKEDDYVSISFTNTITCYTVTLNSGVPEEIKNIAKNTTEINGILCYVDDMPDVGRTQIYFEHKGNFYIIGGTDNEILFTLIENLKEVQ